MKALRRNNPDYQLVKAKKLEYRTAMRNFLGPMWHILGKKLVIFNVPTSPINRAKLREQFNLIN